MPSLAVGDRYDKMMSNIGTGNGTQLWLLDYHIGIYTSSGDGNASQGDDSR
ncbi:MAG: hypothetical protein F6K47_07290 [Symploca sp. SIO2E6]|nr:hypothetical protein [Symploca sp. SIO2E6]